MSKKIIKRKIKKERIILFLLLLLLISCYIIIYQINEKYSDKILPSMFINDENYSNLTKQQALNKLDNKVKDFRDKGITLSFEDKTFVIPLSELGITIDTTSAVQQIYQYGHSKNTLDNLKDYLSTQQKNIDYWIETKFDHEKMNIYIKKNFSKIESQPENFQYSYEKNNFIPIKAKSGIIIDQTELRRSISNNITNFQNQIIKINLVKKEPEITVDENEAALIQAKNLIKNKIILKYDESQWEVLQADLALWIDFKPSKNNNLGIRADYPAIEDYLLTIVPQINREPINAQLDFSDGKVEMFSLSQEGIALQVEKSIVEIDKTIFKPENYTEAFVKDDEAKKKEFENIIEVQMITKNVEPKITTESIDNMGITSLLATGESNFAGSPNNRRHNIAVGAGKFQGILIGPGDVFSFVEALGNVGPREGYLPELVIKKGATIPEYGGGLCQVSTTAFRAAVLAGLEITERKNHAYAVSYYSPQGTDATIYPPHPDLRFKNNTPAYILIQTRIKGNKLSFDFYGSDDGRKVKTKGPLVYDRKKDGSMKSVWTQQVYNENEKLLFENKFYSNYKSPNLYPHKNPLE